MSEQNKQEEILVEPESDEAHENSSDSGNQGNTPDERVAPSSPRTEVKDEESETDNTSDKDAPASSRRPNAKTLVAAAAACAVVLCAVTAGIGYAAGWFGGNPAPVETAQTTSPSVSPSDEKTPSEKKADKQDSEAESSEAKEDKAVEVTPEDSSSQTSDAAVPQDTASAPAEPGDASGASAETSAVAPAPETPALVPAPVPEPEPAPAPAPVAPSTVTVSVYVDSSRASSQGWPSSMASTSVTLNQGASVYDALCASGVAVGGSSGYVSSINGLAEFACGNGSGWLYFVNGSSPGYGCGSYILNGGESITWVYTCDLGNDV